MNASHMLETTVLHIFNETASLFIQYGLTCIVYNTSQAIRFTGYFLINTRLSADINAVFQN